MADCISKMFEETVAKSSCLTEVKILKQGRRYDTRNESKEKHTRRDKTINTERNTNLWERRKTKMKEENGSFVFWLKLKKGTNKKGFHRQVAEVQKIVEAM